MTVTPTKRIATGSACALVTPPSREAERHALVFELPDLSAVPAELVVLRQ